MNMEVNLKKKETIFIILGVILVLTSIINNKFNYDKNNSILRNDNISNIKGLTSSVEIGKIHIDNNWTDVKAAELCTGDGTYSNPYVIEDLIIDVEGWGNGILIENSNAFFTIENVTIYNSGTYKGAIFLFNASNGKLINNNLSSNSDGIISWFSDNNTFIGNMIYNNSEIGMNLNDCDNNTISENFIYECGQGIILIGEGNKILENNVNDVNVGMDLMSMNSGIVSGNILNNNYIGITLYSCINSNITGNTIYENMDGIRLERSEDINISGNILNRNFGDGIRLYLSYNCDIKGNTISYSYYGIRLEQSEHNFISRNILYYNRPIGIFLESGSRYNDIIENNIIENDHCIYVDTTKYNTIYFNNFKDNQQKASSLTSTNHWNSIKKVVYIYKGINFTNYLGNYWDDYLGTDGNNDGIGDFPYIINKERDYYPLMEPIENYTIIKIAESKRREIASYNLLLLISFLSIAAIIMSNTVKNNMKKKSLG